MKVALVLPAEPEMAPYIHYYTNILEQKSIDYDLIAWNRSGNNLKHAKNLIMYEVVSPDTLKKSKKVAGYIGFVRFVKKRLQAIEYDVVIIHTILPAVLLSRLLLKKYAGRYILDIRDRGSLLSLWKYRLKDLLSNSALNVISSPGFKRWLPKGEFCLSHNIGLNGLEGKPIVGGIFFGEMITILSIGQIRFYEANKFVIDSLANNKRYYMHYAGFGPDSERLKEYCTMNHIDNVYFSGRYLKQDEPQILANSDFINIVFPNTIGALYAMPNRFYGAAIFRKPVIVSEGSIQAEYVRKYGMGIVVSQTDNLRAKIESYIESFDANEFIKGCDDFLEEIKSDNLDFENHFIGVLTR